MSKLARLTKRNKELSALFKRLYEDNVFGRVTKEQFRMLSESCNGEQRTLADRLTALTDEIEQQKSAANNVDRFVALARKYTDIQ